MIARAAGKGESDMAQRITHENIGLPAVQVSLPKRASYGLFDFSSHAHAREVLEFALQMKQPEFNVFLSGQNRSSRLSATFAFVKKALAHEPAAHDWVYLHHFEEPHAPQAFRFPAGQGAVFAQLLEQSVRSIMTKYANALETAYFSTKAHAAQERFKKYIVHELEKLRVFALPHHFDVQWGTDGSIRPIYLKEKEDPNFEKVETSIWDQLVAQLQALDVRAEEKKEALHSKLIAAKKGLMHKVMAGPLEKLRKKFADVAGLESWLQNLSADLWDGAALVEQDDKDLLGAHIARYAVNVLTQSQPGSAPPIIVEPTPNYENLFGQVMYEATSEGHQTDHRLIRAGALHRANGGVLILRAESIAENPHSWSFLKAALRDREIRIEEPHRAQAVPLFQAPRPQAIPLDVKIILIGTPMWYYLFCANDPDFQTYFKMNAEIDEFMDLDAHNIRVAAGLLQQESQQNDGPVSTPEALASLLSYSSRWAGDRRKMPSQFDKMRDIISQAATVARRQGSVILTREIVQSVLLDLEKRSQRPQRHAQELIAQNILHIQTQDAVVGQINGLSVMSGGDISYGMPMRITATTAMGSRGIVNVERQTQMSGPLHQKSVFILEGFLQRRFAQDFPLCMSCMLTVEQNYGMIDGDSASLAEVCAILSSLSDVPIQQGIAITGSMNQLGQAQAVGGVLYKVEAFYDTCRKNGLTRRQGVIIPYANMKELVLKDALVEDIKSGHFNIWAVKTVDEALALLLDHTISPQDQLSDTSTVWGRVHQKLQRFARYHEPRYQPL